MDITIERKCEKCVFWYKNNKQCRKNAPRMIVACCGVGENPEYSTDWPPIGKNEWCGEFRPKE